MLTTWRALPEDSTGLCAWWCLQGFGVPPRTETTTPRPSLTRDPSQRAKSFAQNGEGLKTSLGWRVQPIFPFCVGPDGFPPICPCPHEGRYTRYEVLVWRTLRGKNFVACKIATTYGEDLSLEGGVVLYNTSILIPIAMGAFAPSIYEWVQSSKAESGVADLGRLCRLGICPRSLCVPGLGVGTLHCHCMGPHAGWVCSSCP